MTRHRCPNCLECVPFRRIFTPGRQWRCAHCGTLLAVRENSLISVGFVILGLLAYALCALTPQNIPDWLLNLPGAPLSWFLVWILGLYIALRLVDTVVVVVECCHQCGYHLRGLTEPRCPECGMEFTPPSPDERSPPTGN